MKKLKIYFTNNLEEFIEPYYSALKNEYIYYYDVNTQIKDLFLWLYEKIDTSGDYFDDILREHFLVVLNQRKIKVRLEYNLNDFLKNNSVSKLYLWFATGIGGGNGGYIPTLGTIRINPNEDKHKYIPHVHIYKNRRQSYDYSIRINLNDLTQMKGDAKSIDKLFNKNQKKTIYGYLNYNRQELIDYYNRVQNGEYVEPIYLKYNGKVVEFK